MSSPASPAPAPAAPAAYTELTTAFRRIHRLGGALGLLHWDQEVNLPPASAPARGEELAVLAEIAHREFTRPEIGALIEKLAATLTTLTPEQACVVRWAKLNYDRATRLPPEFVARKAEAQSRAYHAWTAARAAKNFAAFAPHLQTQLDHAREEAAYQGFEKAPYDYWLDQHDHGLTAVEVDRLFAPLREKLPALAERILAGAARKPAPVLRGFPIEAQEKLVREVVAWLGFDFERGRLDRSVHPFCGGHAEDVRMTTRFDGDNPLDALFSSIHETGHALYEQGLPREHVGTALSEAVGMAVHESQSRLWENQVCRGRGFWRYWEPRFRAAFPAQTAGLTSEQLELAVNTVSRQPIRVDADEVTYNLHVMLRFDMEQAFFRGDLTIADAPAAWNQLAQKYLGLAPRDDAEGILQDVHWSHGSFGYFPSYTLGNMLAAQLWETLQKALPNLEENLAAENLPSSSDSIGTSGEIGSATHAASPVGTSAATATQTAPLRTWLRENIHRHGKMYDTAELTRRATGENLSAHALLRYLEDRYGKLYAT